MAMWTFASLLEYQQFLENVLVFAVLMRRNMGVFWKYVSKIPFLYLFLQNGKKRNN